MLLLGEGFRIEIDEATGTPRSLVALSDPYGMNWIRGDYPFGTVLGFSLLSVECREGGASASYEDAAHTLRLVVLRYAEGGKYREVYTFCNVGEREILLSEENVGIVLAFNDLFDKKENMLHTRCNSHVWCAEDVLTVQSVKLSGQPPYLIQRATEGRFSGYGLLTDVAAAEYGSHDRGNIVLYPEARTLLPGEEARFAFEFYFTEEREPLSPVTADRYSAFVGETFTLSVDTDAPPSSLSGEVEGRRLTFFRKGGRTCATVSFDTVGARRIDLTVEGRRTHLFVNVLLPLSELLSRRVRFITEKQQYRGEDTRLFGAYLILDLATGEQYYNEGFADHNAARERLSMGTLVAHSLSRQYDEAVAASLRLHRDFIEREILDVATGFVRNGVGRENVRLYNFPWVSTYYLEWYRFSGEVECLRIAARVLCKYYELGGAKQESPCLSAFEILSFLEREGCTEEYAALRCAFVAHGDAIVERRTASHSSEVACANGMMNLMCTFLFGVYLLEKDEKYLSCIRELLSISEGFYDRQPDYRMHGIALRFWDMYWFGRREAYGDTYPQWLSSLTAEMYHFCDLATGSDHGRLIRENLLGNLAVYFEDGAASCAYLYPRRVTTFTSRPEKENPLRPIGVFEGERYSVFANDQDWALYHALKYLK